MKITAEILASCIKRAERDNKGHFNEYYWYTREKCVQIASENKIHIGKVIGLTAKLDCYYFNNNKKAREANRKLDEFTNTIWDSVVHPEIICKSILEG